MSFVDRSQPKKVKKKECVNGRVEKKLVSERVGAFSRNGTRQSKLACAIWQIVSMENLTISDG